jgi:hypothetical protein
MTDTTSISDLPTDPVNGGNVGAGNITMVASEKTDNNNANNAPVVLDQTTISQIITGIQQASTSGATMLPSRDIPRTTTGITQDPNIQPNYIPPPRNPIDYIQEYQNPQNMINNYNHTEKIQNSIDDMYDEFQTPILLAALFFLFQLPFFKKLIYNYFPALFLNDGNYNLGGYAFNSVLFGLLFFTMTKITKHFGTF